MYVQYSLPKFLQGTVTATGTAQYLVHSSWIYYSRNLEADCLTNTGIISFFQNIGNIWIFVPSTLYRKHMIHSSHQGLMVKQDRPEVIAEHMVTAVNIAQYVDDSPKQGQQLFKGKKSIYVPIFIYTPKKIWPIPTIFQHFILLQQGVIIYTITYNRLLHKLFVNYFFSQNLFMLLVTSKPSMYVQIIIIIRFLQRIIFVFVFF